MTNHSKKLLIALAFTVSSQHSQAQFASQLNLDDLNGSNGFVINGEHTDDYLGTSVSHAGDVNDDGIDDVIIGTFAADSNGNSGAGKSYVVFGNDSGLPHPLNLSSIDGTNGIVINGQYAGDRSGISVSYTGDVNGDGTDDLIIGANGADPNFNSFAGRTFIVFGSDTFLTNPLNLSDIDGLIGIEINGANTSDNSGRSVNNAGDVNGDGIDDLIIGAPSGNAGTGSSYVVYGNDNGLPIFLNLSDIDGSNGFVINGVNQNDNSGFSVSHAGDINNDGIDDVIIGAYTSEPNANSGAGSSYVVFGSDVGLTNPLNLSSIDGTNGFVINGVNQNDSSGFSVSHAGDVNGDGIDDVIIGAYLAGPNGNSNAGSSYVIFGSEDSFPSLLNLSDIDGNNGFIINGANQGENSGFSVSHAGDINGDGIDDVIIGAYTATPNGNSGAGRSYVVFGSDTGLPNPLELSGLNGQNGFVINGVNTGDLSGISVSSAGDVNGDGIDDVIIGAYGADPNGISDAGSSYVVFGDDTIFKDGLE